MHAEFKNEPFTDFSQPQNAAAFQKALDEVRAAFGRTYPLWIDGREVQGGGTFPSLNPAHTDEVLGHFQKADPAQAEQAIEAASRAFETWKHTPARERAELLFSAANRMRQRKHWFSAWMVYEVGKSWAEADADTAEAIDFMEFYAREMLRYAADQPITKLPGEENELVYIPLGVGVIVPPVELPAGDPGGHDDRGHRRRQHRGAEALERRAGHRLAVREPAARGGRAGRRAQLRDRLRAAASATGSSTTPRRASSPSPAPRKWASASTSWRPRRSRARSGSSAWWPRWAARTRSSSTADADLDRAADAVVAAAFGFQGQKCSACSRAIVDEKVYDAFLPKIVERAKKIVVGAPEERGVYMGPVINEKAQETILGYIETGKQDGTAAAGRRSGPEQGLLRPAHVIADVDPKAVISQEEIFGPVLAVIKARDFEHALEIANNTEYGLTGSVYTRDQAKIDEAKRRFHVGNLYINRKCTGAMVGAHPFGGFNMSGTDSKAGGRDYLLLFLQAKSMSRLK